MLYLSVFILLLYLSFRYDLMGSKINKDFWYVFMLVVFILIAGLRYRIGFDTPNYLYSFYHIYPSFEKFSFSDYPIGNDPIWVFLNSIVKSMGGRFYHVQLIHAAFINILIFKYIKKHSAYIFTCLFFYAYCCYLNYNMQIMRGSLSIVICLFANDYILDKKWLKGYALYGLALLCHTQTLVIFILPLFMFMRLNIKGCLLIVLAFVLGKFIQSSFGDYLFLLEEFGDAANKAESYMDSDVYGEMNDNFKSWFVRFLYDFIYAIFALWFLKYKNKNSNILCLEPFVMVGLAVLMIQANLQIIYRYVDYFRIYFILFYAELFIVFAKKVLKMPKITAFFMMLVLFSPYIFLAGYLRKDSFEQYYPYSSVIEKDRYEKRELFYRRYDRAGFKNDEY